MICASWIPNGALWSDGSQEADCLGGLEPGCLERHEQCLDRLVRNEQGVAGVVKTAFDDVPVVRAVRLVLEDPSVAGADSGHCEARSGERLTGLHADHVEPCDTGIRRRVDRNAEPREPQHVDVVAVFMRDEHRIGVV